MKIDDAIGNSDLFPVLKHWDFFNHAGVAPIPRPAGDALRQFAREAEEGAYLNTKWYADIDALRETSARIINADKDEIAFVKNTSEGLSIVARGLEWQWGDRIVTTNVEYPANIYPWMELARSRGIKLVMVPEETDAEGRRHVPLEKILKEVADPRTRLVTLSHVEFASGQRHDLAKIGAFCRSQRKLFCVDAIQSVGVLPVDVKAMHIDFLSADGHKWMLGPEGAGIFFCRRHLLERLRPNTLGASSVINAQQYGNYDYTLRSDAGRFESGSHNLGGLFALKASLELLQSVGIDAIAQRVRYVTDKLVAGLISKGYGIVSPRERDQWSGAVAFYSMKHRHEEIVRTLRKSHRCEIALREGRLRVSPHFYNRDEQIERFLAYLPPH